MTFETIILAAAKTAKISGALLLAICAQESGLKNIYTPDDGGTPTYGICQVKFGTAQMMGYHGAADGLMKPATNAKYAAKYLKYQETKYSGNWCKMTAAYNSGTFRIEKRSGKPKNIQYVLKVSKKLQEDLRPKLACDTVKTDRQEKESK